MTSLYRFLTFIGAIFFVCRSVAEKPQSPSEFANSPETVPLVTFVLVESRDFRLLFCTPEKLKTRIERKVCVIDTISGGPREILVENGDTVRSILTKVDKNKSTSQIRLITTNTIEQTPVAAHDDERNKLLERFVTGGDILVLAARN
jgi:hypothetical protein